jgi:hypothetical protein
LENKKNIFNSRIVIIIHSIIIQHGPNTHHLLFCTSHWFITFKILSTYLMKMCRSSGFRTWNPPVLQAPCTTWLLLMLHSECCISGLYALRARAFQSQLYKLTHAGWFNHLLTFHIVFRQDAELSFLVLSL